MFPRRPTKPNLDKITPGAAIVARDGTRYRVDHVITDGNKKLHSMTLERETPKRDKSMSPRQWRNKRKAERRLERDRRERRLEAARRLDEVNAHQGGTELLEQLAAGDADIIEMPRVAR